MERLLGKTKATTPAEPVPLVREERPAPAVVRPWDKHKDKYGKNIYSNKSFISKFLIIIISQNPINF